ncbi:hypothetical protein D3C71_1468370 [compost metagenome]
MVPSGARSTPPWLITAAPKLMLPNTLYGCGGNAVPTRWMSSTRSGSSSVVSAPHSFNVLRRPTVTLPLP